MAEKLEATSLLRSPKLEIQLKKIITADLSTSIKTEKQTSQSLSSVLEREREQEQVPSKPAALNHQTNKTLDNAHERIDTLRSMLKLTNAKTALAEKKLPEEKTNTDVEEKKNTEKVQEAFSAKQQSCQQIVNPVRDSRNVFQLYQELACENLHSNADLPFELNFLQSGKLERKSSSSALQDLEKELDKALNVVDERVDRLDKGIKDTKKIEDLLDSCLKEMEQT
ncbi:uncharacterized protein LOC143466236 isoform X2 [Clavelina lepadiformis]|uniref:uncharacterized protein LOC143466236 isoform X2 n=1 Tax=Clavelina lepadiformis TaxID=159417 RepID=UPI0040414668